MPVIILYVTSALTLAALDAVMLTAVMQPLFKAHIGGLMTGSPRLLPAALFYLGYVAGLVALVSLPALRAGSAGQAALNGAILGAVAYGTYELTSMTILKDWAWPMVLADMAWGTVLTAASAWAGVRIAQALA